MYLESLAGRRTSLLRTIINIASKYPPRLNISSNVTNRSAECIKSASITESVRSVNPGRYRSGSFSISGTKETSTVVRDFYEETGFKSINQYTIMHNIGHGIHGKVKLCYNNDTGEYCAMKVVYKNPRRSFTSRFLLKDSTSGFHKQFDIREAHVSNIRKEIAIMKACSHPNIVRLYEVIDDPEENKIYLCTYCNFILGSRQLIK